MSYSVHLSVVFSCNHNDEVAKIARRHLSAAGDNREACAFLEDLAKRTGVNPGPNGGLSLWGIVGNYTDADEFVDVLRPFWRDLLSGDYVDGPGRDAHVIVFAEPEEAGRAIAFEVALDKATGEVVADKHTLPFAWMQL